METVSFVKTYVWAYKNNKTSAEVADKLGMELKQVYAKANTLRKRGVKLQELRKNLGVYDEVDSLNSYIEAQI